MASEDGSSWAVYEYENRITSGHIVISPSLRELKDMRKTTLPFIPPDNDGYDPRKNRHPKNPIKPWMAYLNLVRLGFGPGLLAIPLATSQAGIVLGPVLCILVGILLTHTQIMLLNCLNEVCRQLKTSRISYRYAFRMCLLHGPPIFHFLGHHGPGLIAVFMFMSQLSICTVFYIFTADSLRDIFDMQSNVPAMIVLLIPYMFLQLYLQTLMQISVVALTANVMNLAGLGIIFYHIFDDPHGETVAFNLNIQRLLFAFGTMLFNMSSVGIIITLDKGLENPEIMTKRFGVIQIGILLPSLFAAIYGALGYWSFGTMEENILRSLPYDSDATILCMTCYLVSVMLTYPIQCYPGTRVIVDFIEKHDPLVLPTEETLLRFEKVFRPVFVLLTFVICYTVPFQAPFVAFCGSLCTNLLAVVFPAMMDICLLYPDRYGKHQWILIKDLMIIALGVVCWIWGVYISGYLIYIRIQTLEQRDDFT